MRPRGWHEARARPRGLLRLVTALQEPVEILPAASPEDPELARRGRSREKIAEPDLLSMQRSTKAGTLGQRTDPALPGALWRSQPFPCIRCPRERSSVSGSASLKCTY